MYFSSTPTRLASATLYCAMGNRGDSVMKLTCRLSGPLLVRLLANSDYNSLGIREDSVMELTCRFDDAHYSFAHSCDCSVLPAHPPAHSFICAHSISFQSAATTFHKLSVTGALRPLRILFSTDMNDFLLSETQAT